MPSIYDTIALTGFTLTLAAAIEFLPLILQALVSHADDDDDDDNLSGLT